MPVDGVNSAEKEEDVGGQDFAGIAWQWQVVSSKQQRQLASAKVHRSFHNCSL